MKRIVYLLCAAALCLQSCTFIKVREGDALKPSGNLTTVESEIDDFTAVSIANSLDVNYVLTDGAPYIRINGSSNLVERVEDSVTDGVLKISFKGGVRIIGNWNLDVTVASHKLNGVYLSGSGSFEASKIETEHFDVSLVGSGEVEVDGLSANDVSVNVAGSGDAELSGLDCKVLNASVLGSGDIDVKGYAAVATLAVSGSGSIEASGLRYDDVYKEITGSGEIEVR